MINGLANLPAEVAILHLYLPVLTWPGVHRPRQQHGSQPAHYQRGKLIEAFQSHHGRLAF